MIKEAAYRKRLDLGATRRSAERANGRAALTCSSARSTSTSTAAPDESPHEDAFLALLPPTVAEPSPTRSSPASRWTSWPEQRLVVEIDGGGHDRPTARRKDALEDRVLRAAGYRILRFTDTELEQRPRTSSPA